MADQLITGTTLVEKESRSIGDIPVGGIIEWDDTFGNLPDGFVECDGSTINDPQSSWNGTAVQDLNTNYKSISAFEFKASNPDISDILYQQARLFPSGNDIVVFSPVELPNGITITEVIVYGAISGETWTFNRADFDNNITSQATAVIGTEDTSITNPIVDNENYQYFLTTTSLDNGDIINGARITYEPRFKFIMRTR